MLKKVSVISVLAATLLLSGCGASYEAVKPNMTTKVQPADYENVVELSHYRTIENSSEIVLDMKLIPYNNHYLSAKLFADKQICFDYIAPLRTSGNDNVSITEEVGVPANFQLIEKVKLPSYKAGVNVFDLNNKGNFAYISDNKTIKVINKIPTETVVELAKNKKYSDNNILTIKTKRAVEQIAFQKNSNNLIVVLDNNTVELWDYTKKKKTTTLFSDKSKITTIKMSPLGDYLLVSDQKQSNLIDLKSKKSILNIAGDVSASDFTKNEKLLAVVGDSSEVMVYDIKSKKLIQKFPHQHKGSVYGLVFSPVTDSKVITAGQDAAVKVWDLSNTTQPIFMTYNSFDNTSHCNADFIEKQYFSDTSTSLSAFNKKYAPQKTQCNILGDKDQVISFAQKGILYPYMESLVDTLVNKYTSVKDEWIYVDVLDPTVGSAKAEIAEWKQKNGVKTTVPDQANPRVSHTYYKVDNAKYQHFLNTDKKILTYKAESVKKHTKEYLPLISQMNGGAIYGMVPMGNKVYTYGTGFREAYGYKPSQSSVRLTYGGYETKFNFEKLNNQYIYEVIDKDTFKDAGRTQYVIKTKDDHTIITVKNNVVQFFDYKTHKLVDMISENASVKAIAYDKVNDTLAIGLDNGSVKLWNLKTRQPAGELLGHKGEIASLSFANKGTVLISGAYDESAIVWNVKTKTKITQFTGFERAAKRIQVLPKQNMVALVSSGDTNSDIFFYSLKDFTLIKKVSPQAGIIRGIAFDKEGKRVILASSGETFNRQKGHILLTVDTGSFETTKKYYNPPFKYVVGLVANESTDTLYAIGTSSVIQRLDLHSLAPVDKLYNMENDKYSWGKIHAVGATEQSMPIVADGTGLITIYK